MTHFYCFSFVWDTLIFILLILHPFITPPSVSFLYTRPSSFHHKLGGPSWSWINLLNLFIQLEKKIFGNVTSLTHALVESQIN